MTALIMNEVSPITLVIPGKPEYVGLCRLVAGVVGTRESLDEESIADLKLVVTEACTCLLFGADGEPSGDGSGDANAAALRVDFRVAPEAWEITVSDPDRKRALGACGPTGEGSLGLAIINALVDSVERTETEAEGSVIRLVKRFPARRSCDG